MSSFSDEHPTAAKLRSSIVDVLGGSCCLALLQGRGSAEILFGVRNANELASERTVTAYHITNRGIDFLGVLRIVRRLRVAMMPACGFVVE